MRRAAVVIVFLALVAAAVGAAQPAAVTAVQAFDAVQLQVDPLTGQAAKVLLVDVRTRAEWYWIGAPAAATLVTMDDGRTYTPDLGKVVLALEGKFLDFAENRRPRRVRVSKVASVTLTPVAVNVPLKLWDEATATMLDNADFVAQVADLVNAGSYDVVIFYCRSGHRSQQCVTDDLIAALPVTVSLFEIDVESEGLGGYGGFEGSTYGNAFIGYRGFPGRETRFEEIPSVSWEDSGLPIKIGVSPF